MMEAPADASTLIYLAKAEAFEEVAFFLQPILAPPAVWVEAVDQGVTVGAPEVDRIREAEKGLITKVTLTASIRRKAARLGQRHRIGRGESEVLAMAYKGDLVIVDEGRATSVALAVGLIPFSTLFLPLLGMRLDALNREQATSFLHRLAGPTGARSSTISEIEQRLEEWK
jgi:predicted nucleic acid-binding protein